MANRKGIFKALGLLTAGFLLGAIIAGLLVAMAYSKMFRQRYYDVILSNTSNAFMIRAERQEELLKLIEGNIQGCILSADFLSGDDERRLNAFWYVQRYYEKYKIPVPDEIKSIFAQLPPDPRKEKFVASTLISVGDKAPDFTCTTVNGETISLSGLQGKVVLINFFATWCGPCITEMPYLQSEVFEKFSGDDFFMIAIAREQQVDDITEFMNAKEKVLTFPMAADPDKSIYDLFATGYIPRNFLIDKDGIVKWVSGGLSKPQIPDLVSLIRTELE